MTQDPQNPVESQDSILGIFTRPILVGGFLDNGVAVGQDLGGGNIQIPAQDPPR